jgi:hypothetical protein
VLISATIEVNDWIFTNKTIKLLTRYEDVEMGFDNLLIILAYLIIILMLAIEFFKAITRRW